jgi:hypothetical protein
MSDETTIDISTSEGVSPEKVGEAVNADLPESYEDALMRRRRETIATALAQGMVSAGRVILVKEMEGGIHVQQGGECLWCNGPRTQAAINAAAMEMADDLIARLDK